MQASPVHVRPVSSVIYLQPLPVLIANINVPLQIQTVLYNVCLPLPRFYRFC